MQRRGQQSDKKELIVFTASLIVRTALCLLLFVSCSPYRSRQGESHSATVDTALLERQIDSIDANASRHDTAACKRLLTVFHDTDLAKNMPRLVYEAYFQASNIPIGTDSAIQRYLHGVNEDMQHLAKAVQNEHLLLYSEFLAARQQSNLGNNALAFPKLLELKDRFQQLKDSFGQCLVLKRIGLVYHVVYKSYERAAFQFRAALALSTNIGQQQENAAWLVKSYCSLRHYDSLAHYRDIYRRLSMHDDPVNRWEVEACYYVLRYVQGIDKSADFAGPYVDSVVGYYETARLDFRFNDVLGYVSTYCSALIRDKELERAGDLLSRLEKITGKQRELPVNIPALYGVAADYYATRGNTRKAYEFLNAYLEQSRKINLQELKEQTELAAIEYEASRRRSAQQQVVQQSELNARTFRITTYSLIAITIVLVALGLLALRQARLRRTLEQEKLRNTLSRDLHDEIGSTLSSINILSRSAQQSLSGNPGDSFQKINDRSQRLLDSMSDIIWNIKPGADSIEEVMSRMREYATGVLEAKNIEYSFSFPDDLADSRLTMEVKNNLYLVFKEAVNNLVKYSGCNNANFSIKLTEKELQLRVEDNGKGFDQEALTRISGLRNMQTRAADMHGFLRIDSAVGAGTSIFLSIPRFHQQKKAGSKLESRSLRFIPILLSAAAGLVILGCMFKILHWPGGNMFMFAGLFIASVGVPWLVFHVWKDRGRQ